MKAISEAGAQIAAMRPVRRESRGEDKKCSHLLAVPRGLSYGQPATQRASPNRAAPTIGRSCGDSNFEGPLHSPHCTHAFPKEGSLSLSHTFISHVHSYSVNVDRSECSQSAAWLLL